MLCGQCRGKAGLSERCRRVQAQGHSGHSFILGRQKGSGAMSCKNLHASHGFARHRNTRSALCQRAFSQISLTRAYNRATLSASLFTPCTYFHFNKTRSEQPDDISPREFDADRREAPEQAIPSSVHRDCRPDVQHSLAPGTFLDRPIPYPRTRHLSRGTARFQIG